jgi:hypothetical protein
MTREEAIHCLSVHSSTNGSGLCTDEQHYEAKQMSIKALEQEPCGDVISRQDDRGVSLKSVKHVLYDVCLHEDNMALFSELLDRVNKLRDWEEYLTIKQEPCEDAISRQALLKLMGEEPFNWTDSNQELQAVEDYRNFRNMVEQLPSVNQQELKTGHREYNDIYDHYLCENCKTIVMDYDNFCPNCGAKMVEEQERSEQNG